MTWVSFPALARRSCAEQAIELLRAREPAGMDVHKVAEQVDVGGLSH